MAVFRFVSLCSTAGRSGSSRLMPTAVTWYGAMASNHTLLSNVVVRRMSGASPGATTWNMTGTTAGITTSTGAWSSAKENELCPKAGNALRAVSTKEDQIFIGDVGRAGAGRGLASRARGTPELSRAAQYGAANRRGAKRPVANPSDVASRGNCILGDETRRERWFPAATWRLVEDSHCPLQHCSLTASVLSWRGRPAPEATTSMRFTPVLLALLPLLACSKEDPRATVSGDAAEQEWPPPPIRDVSRSARARARTTTPIERPRGVGRTDATAQLLASTGVPSRSGTGATRLSRNALAGPDGAFQGRRAAGGAAPWFWEEGSRNQAGHTRCAPSSSTRRRALALRGLGTRRAVAWDDRR